MAGARNGTVVLTCILNGAFTVGKRARWRPSSRAAGGSAAKSIAAPRVAESRAACDATAGGGPAPGGHHFPGHERGAHHVSHLILGGTGTVGSAVVRGLLARGEEVRVLTRSAERAAALPQGAQAVIGDLADPATYEQAFAGTDRLFLLNAVVNTELQEGLAAVNEA